VPLVLYEGPPNDPGLFDQSFYGQPDNVTTSGMFFIENPGPDPVTAYFSFASDDAGHLYVDGDLVLGVNVCRGYGPANTIQDGPQPHQIPVGTSIVQMSMAEGGGGAGFRVRVTKDCIGSRFSPEELVIRANLTPEAPFAKRTIDDRIEGETLVIESEIVVENTNEDVTIEEIIPENWRVVSTEPPAQVLERLIVWSASDARTFSYRLERSGACSPGIFISGSIDFPAVGSRVIRGDQGLSLCSASPDINRLLVTPAISQLGGCNATGLDIEGAWLEGDFNEREFIPEDGLLFLPDFVGVSQADAFSADMSVDANARFFDEDGPETLGRVVAVDTAAANGYFNWQDVTIYGADTNNVMNVAFFYAINEQDEPLDVALAVGSDDSFGLRLNGYPVSTTLACRGHSAFSNRVLLTLDPGKNLISLYTFEGGGGFGSCMRFEDTSGVPSYVPWTLDPTGYDPDDHGPPAGTGDDTPAINPFGFVTRFLVPRDPLDTLVGAGTLDDALPEDYISIDGEAPDFDNVRAGAPIEAGLSGLLTTAVRNLDGVTELVEFQGTGSDSGLFNGETFYGGQDQYSSTGFFFLVNNGPNRNVYIGFASDDSAHLYVNGQTAGFHNGGRGFGAPNTIQNGPFEVELEGGANLIQISYTEGGGGSGMRVGVWPDQGRCDSFDPEEVFVCLNPDDEDCEATDPPPPDGVQLLRGDADDSGTVNITDGIFILNFLFLGGASPQCEDSADADDSGAVNITDGIFVLNFLFLGGDTPPAPTGNCGVDPTEDTLFCEADQPNCAN
ncbi:MAG: hypothetical protein AAF488_11650, partial [Planctomycetota bacterium]